MARETDRSITVRDNYGREMTISTEHWSEDKFSGFFSHRITREKFIRMDGIIHTSELGRVMTAAQELAR
jgi:hypothetical protein